MANYKREVIIYDLIIDGNVVFTGTADEIAEKLGISSVTVYTRHRKGKHILQEKCRELRTLTRKQREDKKRRKVFQIGHLIKRKRSIAIVSYISKLETV